MTSMDEVEDVPQFHISRRRSSAVSSSKSSTATKNSSDSENTSHSTSSTVKLGRSIGNFLSHPTLWTRKHLHPHNEVCPESPRLHEKYGDYVKPSRKSNQKASGATNKNNIGSGATAVIRLVQSPQSILAVKEFIKRGKFEDEKEYMKRMNNEYCISKTVSGHKNVVETIDLVMDEHDRWCTVMEYVSATFFFFFFFLK
jgi:hypothetical protein